MQDVVVLMHEGVAHLRRTRGGPPPSTAHESSQRGSSGRARPRRRADRGDSELTTCAGGGDPDAAAAGAAAAAGGGGGDDDILGGRGVRVLGGSGAGDERGRSGLGREAERRRGLSLLSRFPQSWPKENRARGKGWVVAARRGLYGFGRGCGLGAVARASQARVGNRGPWRRWHSEARASPKKKKLGSAGAEAGRLALDGTGGTARVGPWVMRHARVFTVVFFFHSV